MKWWIIALTNRKLGSECFERLLQPPAGPAAHAHRQRHLGALRVSSAVKRHSQHWSGQRSSERLLLQVQRPGLRLVPAFLQRGRDATQPVPPGFRYLCTRQYTLVHVVYQYATLHYSSTTSQRKDLWSVLQHFFYFWAYVSTISTGGAGTVPPLVLVEQALNHQCNGKTNTVPPLVMEMQTGSTNSHISQIFFVLAAPVYKWWYWLAAPVLMV